MECLKCNKKLLKKDIAVTCCDCKRISHSTCTRLNSEEVKLHKERGAPWRCRLCTKQKDRLRGKEAEDPQKKKFGRGNPAKIEKGMGDTKREPSAMWDKIDETKKDVNHSLDNFYDKLVEDGMKLSSTREDMTASSETLHVLKMKNERLTKEIETLTYRLDMTEQSTRRNALEIYGVPDRKGENVMTVIKQIGTAIDFVIKDEMIDTCYRINRQSKNGFHSIIVFFVRRFDKEGFLRMYRTKKTQLNAKDLGRKEDSNIYIRESLSLNKQHLLMETKKVAKQLNFKGVGVVNGEIFIKKKDNSPIVYIREMKDLQKFLNPIKQDT